MAPQRFAALPRCNCSSSLKTVAIADSGPDCMAWQRPQPCPCGDIESIQVFPVVDMSPPCCQARWLS